MNLAPFLFIFSFSVIVFLIARKKNFGIAMLIGSAILGISIPGKLYKIFISTISDFTVISLMTIVAMIKILARMLEEGGIIHKIIQFFERKLSPSLIMVAIPAILGLLPVPGGALLSAPIVKKQGDKMGVDDGTMMAINLWYRHIGFMIYPLSTALILLAGLSGKDIYTLILYQIPVFLISFAIGYTFVYKYKGNKIDANDGSIYGILPIIIPVIVAIPLSLFLSQFFTKDVATYISYLFAVPVGIISAFLMTGKIKFEAKDLSISVAIFGIMFFKNIINATGLTTQIPSFFSFLPAIILIPMISFMIGILTAHNMAAIAILYPMFSSIMDINLIVILFISSFFGYLISPLHLCLAVTYEYFHPKFGKFYKKIALPAIVVMVMVVLIYGVILE